MFLFELQIRIYGNLLFQRILIKLGQSSNIFFIFITLPSQKSLQLKYVLDTVLRLDVSVQAMYLLFKGNTVALTVMHCHKPRNYGS